MVIFSSARGVGSHKPGDVGSRCFLTSLQAAGVVGKGKVTRRQRLLPPLLHASCMTWNELLHLSEPQFLICEMGMISAMVALRTGEDTLRAPSREMLLILLFWTSKGPVYELGIQCPGLSPGPQE